MFSDTLFSPSNLKLDRDQQDREVNVRLDASIADFCRLLANYFLLPPTTKVLEYLIRHYK